MAITLKIDAINEFGQGIAQWKDKPAWVDGVLPGETVLTSLKRETPEWSSHEATRLEVVCKERIEAPCPVALDCGGCTIQHAAYRAQQTYKHAALNERFPSIETSWTPAPSRFNWRLRSIVSVTPDGLGTPMSRMGLYRARSTYVIPVDQCEIDHPRINQAREILARIPYFLDIPAYSQKEPQGLRSVGFHTNADGSELHILLWGIEDWIQPEQIPELAQRIRDSIQPTSIRMTQGQDESNVPTRGDLLFHEGPTVVTDTILGHEFTLPAFGFVQQHKDARETLYSHILTTLGTYCEPHTHVCEWFAGSGVLATLLAKHDYSVTTVESDGIAVEHTEANAQLHGVTSQITAKQVNLYKESTPPLAPTLVVDPPRKGLGTKLCQAILAKPDVQTIIYVSCNPATLQRDIELLSDDFTVTSIDGFDLFPHTMHIEAVAVLQRATP